MRYAVFSDVHANREAFQAVLDFFRRSGVDRYVFLGDIVGYGADPEACLSLLKDTAAINVAGNHDWAAAGTFDTDYFNEAAKAAVIWTDRRLAASDKAFLAAWPLVAEEEDFCMVHGTLEDPAQFDYMLDGARARRTFDLLKKSVCFVGHSHLPGVFSIENGHLTYREEMTQVALEPGKRYIINDGSVGQPRDGDPRACCCLYDTVRRLVTFHRIPYDAAEAGRKIRQAGLPLSLADRLLIGH